MSNKLLLGASIFTAASALAGANLMRSGYHNEIKRDSKLAVEAGAFLEREPAIAHEIADLVSNKQAQIDHIGVVVGADCYKVILNDNQTQSAKDQPQTIEDIVDRGNCQLGETAIKDAKKLAKILIDQKEGYLRYLEPTGQYGGQPTLDVAVNDAKSMISDAKTAGPGADLFDSAQAYRLIAVNVSGDQVEEVWRNSDSYNELTAAFWGGLTLIGLVGTFSVATDSLKRRKEQSAAELNSVVIASH